MSQPPPPHQPPPGGHGAGDTPSYGYPPTPPPGSSGDGYPQTPPPGQAPATPPPGPPSTPPPGQTPPPAPTPPMGQPPYSYPQTPPPGQAPLPTPPPGYGQTPPPGFAPTPPMGQPPYGYPATPPPGQGPTTFPTQAAVPGGGYPPGPPPTEGKRSRLVVIVAASVAVLLAVSIGGWFVIKDDGDDKAQSQEETSGTTQGGDSGDSGDSGGSEGQRSDTPEVIDAQSSWQVDAPKVSKKDILTDSRGTWFAGGNLVKALPSGVVAYDMKSGEEAWSLDLKRPKDCGVSGEVSDNRIALTFGTRCQSLAVVDITQGTEAWRKKLPSESGSEYEFSDASIGISGDVVAVSWSGRNGSGFNLDDGSSLWQGESSGNCSLDGYVGGDQLLARYVCYGDDYSGSQVIQGLTPKGEKEWEWQVPKGAEVERVFSQSPLTLGVSAGGSGITDVMVVKESELVQKISIDPERYDLHCSGSVLSDCAGVVVHDNTLFLATEAHEGGKEYSQTNEVVAFDLSSGKAKWQVEAPEDREMALIGLEDGKLMTYQKGDFRTPGKVLQIDLKNQKVLPRMNLPKDSVDLEREVSYTPSTRPYWQDGHFFLVSERFYSGNSMSKYAVVAYH